MKTNTTQTAPERYHFEHRVIQFFNRNKDRPVAWDDLSEGDKDEWAARYTRSHPSLRGTPTPSRYQFEFKGVQFDVYRLLEILGITHHAQAHALKKVIRAGRSVKPLVQDIDEAIASLQRWREMAVEDAKGKDEPIPSNNPGPGWFKDERGEWHRPVAVATPSGMSLTPEPTPAEPLKSDFTPDLCSRCGGKYIKAFTGNELCGVCGREILKR